MKIKTFDKDNIKLIRASLDSHLAAVESEFGIKLDVGTIRFAGNTFSAKISATVGAASQVEGNVKWAIAFQRQAFMYGLKKEDLGKTFIWGGKNCQIVGAMGPKAHRAQIICKQEGSKTFLRLDADSVKMKLAA